MSVDISRQIRAVLDNDTPARSLTELLIAITVLVQQQREVTEWAILDPLTEELESIYKELVDHTSPANLEAFVAILCAFLPVFRPVYVITCWWDLMLRAALRDPRLSPKATQQVKALVSHAVVPSSPKAAEFRKRIIEFYLLDMYDESSGPDTLEDAAMNEEERCIRQFWKQNLQDILEDFCMKRPEEFFTAINVFLTSPQWRLRLSAWLGTVVRSATFPVRAFVEHPILNSLLSLMVDSSSVLFEMELSTLVTLIPRFAIHAPDTLVRILPVCYTILARVVCWDPRSRPSHLLEGEAIGPDTWSQSHQADPEVDTVETSQIRSNLEWQKLDATFVSAASNPPSPHPLFTILYGLYPCNTLAFLKDPVVYLSDTQLTSPFLTGLPDIIDRDQLRARSRALLRRHILHSSLLVHTAGSERAERDRWAQWDVPRIVMMCTMLDTGNAALSIRQVSDVSHIPEVDEDSSSTPSQFEHTKTQDSLTAVTELRGTEFSVPDRPDVSAQDFPDNYQSPRSGIESDILDPPPAWVYTHSSTTIPSHPMESPTAALRPPSPSSGRTLPADLKETISRLQRENLILRTELNGAPWLKRENIKGKGREEVGGEATDSQHAESSNRLEAQLGAETDERRSWADQESKLESACGDAKAPVEAHADRLASSSSRAFELETQIPGNAHEVDRLRDHGHKIDQLIKTHQFWDDDARRYKRQETYLDELRNSYRKKLLLVDSYEKANLELEETIITLQDRISTLESQTLQAYPSASSPVETAVLEMETLRDRVSSLTSERDALQSRADALGDENEELRTTVEGLRDQLRLAKDQTDALDMNM